MIKPTANRLVVKVIAEDAPKEGEKINGNKVMTANVLRVGPDVKAIVPGDIVMFSPFGFDEIEVVTGGDEKEKLVVICEDMILATDEK